MPISIKVGTEHSYVTGIYLCPNEGTHPFPMENNNKIAKYIDEFKNHWANFNQTESILRWWRIHCKWITILQFSKRRQYLFSPQRTKYVIMLCKRWTSIFPECKCLKKILIETNDSHYLNAPKLSFHQILDKVKFSLRRGGFDLLLSLWQLK